MNKTLIGMVVFNNYQFTSLALESLLDNTPELKDGTARLVIIDNNSTDQTVDRIKGRFPDIKDIIVCEKDCMPYQWNMWVDMLEEGEDLCMVPNDVVFGKNWLKLLAEDTYRYPEAVCGSPYMPVDLGYDDVVNEEWARKYRAIYDEVRQTKETDKLKGFMSKLYGDFDKFCEDFQERNKEEPPIDSSLTHIVLFKNWLFTKEKFRFCEEYCPYYGSHEFDMMVELNNRGFLRIGSSRSYVHHWVSITNRRELATTEKQKCIDKNNKRLLRKWKCIPQSAKHFNKPMHSNIPNHRNHYYTYKLRDELLPEGDAVPGIKFMCNEGIRPGCDYFEQIQEGSIVRKDGVSYEVNRNDGKTMDVQSIEDVIITVNHSEFIINGWHIDYFIRREEEEFYGEGHMGGLLHG